MPTNWPRQNLSPRSIYSALLGGFDQYILGPGTGDTELLPAEHRAKMSRTAGWISPLIVVNGRIADTWNIIDSELVFAMFEGAAPPKKQLAAEVEHLSGVLRQDIRPVRVA
jgi:hypothetical protein